MNRNKLNKTGYIYIGLILFWSVAVIIIGLSALPLNPLSLKYVNKINIFSIVPEGWGFFTKNPREPQYYLYKKTAPDKFELITVSSSDKTNYFGLKRTSRVINSELFEILRQINDSLWQKNGGSEASIDLHCDNNISVQNLSKSPNLKGLYTVISQERIPWAWSSSYKSIVMPYRKINILIK